MQHVQNRFMYVCRYRGGVSTYEHKYFYHNLSSCHEHRIASHYLCGSYSNLGYLRNLWHTALFEAAGLGCTFLIDDS